MRFVMSRGARPSWLLLVGCGRDGGNDSDALRLRSIDEGFVDAVIELDEHDVARRFEVRRVLPVGARVDVRLHEVHPDWQRGLRARFIGAEWFLLVIANPNANRNVWIEADE